MKTRIIVAVIAVPLLLAVVIFAPLWAMGIVVAAISAGAAWEFMRAVCPGQSRRIYAYASVVAAFIPLADSLGWERIAVPVAAFVLFVAVFSEIMLSFRGENRLSINLAAFSLVAGVVMPIMLSALVRLGLDGRGWAYMLLPFVAAFSSDSGAYFVGLSLGKHKLAPHLSPKKTIEGSAGGFVCSILFMILYGLVLKALGYDVHLLVMAVYGFFGSLACQLGDLAFSAVKRESGIKDYGTLIPGHGGMLDRFDSMHLTAPMIELLILLVPAITK